jgi:hypothetical protein
MISSNTIMISSDTLNIKKKSNKHGKICVKITIPESKCKMLNFSGIIEIDISHKNLTTLNIEKLPRTLKIFHCDSNRLKKLPKLNDSLEMLFCTYNILYVLPQLNKNLKYLVCTSNNLKKIPKLNKKLTTLICDYNEITFIESFNDNLEYINCNNNKLKIIPHLNNKLVSLKCRDNNIKEILNFNENLKVLECDNNQLFYLPLFNQKLERLCITNNPINSIIFTNNIYYYLYDDQILFADKQIKILYKFRFLFYLLKFKSKLRYFLYVKIKKPKMEKLYSPASLINLLKDIDENNEDIFQETIDKW